MTFSKTGGPAFPVKEPKLNDIPGMSLRDYFAAKALQGLCAILTQGDKAELVPALAYAMADEMLRIRAAK